MSGGGGTAERQKTKGFIAFPPPSSRGLYGIQYVRCGSKWCELVRAKSSMHDPKHAFPKEKACVSAPLAANRADP